MSGIDAAATAKGDRRVQRTRAALLSAFSQLLFGRPYADFGPAEIAERANVGRSTFYEHFQGKEDLLIQSNLPVLEPLAAACAGAAGGAGLEDLLEHVWGQRRFVLALMADRPRTLLARALGERIAQTLSARPGGTDAGRAVLAGDAIAAAQLAVIGDFISGRAGVSPADLAPRLLAMSQAAAKALAD